MAGCNGKDHALEVVYEHAGAVSETVVRWCRTCGSVVIDEDYDGRTSPGAYMAMRTPTVHGQLTILRTAVTDLIAALEAAKRHHVSSIEACDLNFPTHPEQCCTCGADHFNAAITRIIADVKARLVL